MARLYGPIWVDVLSCVRLGIRTTPKEELQCSPAELVHGATLTVPGDLILSKTFVPATSPLLLWLQNKVALFQPTAMSRHVSQKAGIPSRLDTCYYVFLSRTAIERR